MTNPENYDVVTTEDYVAILNTDDGIEREVYNALVNFAKEHQVFDSERMTQMDSPMVEAPWTVAELMDKIFLSSTLREDVL